MKFKKKHWKILKYTIQGSPYEYGYELHSFVSGHKTEALSTVRPLSVENHRQINGNGHEKNWFYKAMVPDEIKASNIAFWKELMAADDYSVFVKDELVG